MGPGGTNALVRTNYVTANLPPTLFSPHMDGTNFLFSFATLPGGTYGCWIQFKNSLDETNWQTGAPAGGDGTVKTITNNMLAAPNRFYRLSIGVNSPTYGGP